MKHSERSWRQTSSKVQKLYEIPILTPSEFSPVYQSLPPSPLFFPLSFITKFCFCFCFLQKACCFSNLFLMKFCTGQHHHHQDQNKQQFSLAIIPALGTGNVSFFKTPTYAIFCKYMDFKAYTLQNGSPDLILCGWLGSKHQPPNCRMVNIFLWMREKYIS